MFKFLRNRMNRITLPKKVNRECRKHPDHAYLAQHYVAVYHSGTDKVLFWLHDNPNMTPEEVDAFLRPRLERYNAKIK